MRTTDDRKIRPNINMRMSHLERIQNVCEETGITKTELLDLCVEYSLPMLENLSKKMISLEEKEKKF